MLKTLLKKWYAWRSRYYFRRCVRGISQALNSGAKAKAYDQFLRGKNDGG